MTGNSHVQCELQNILKSAEEISANCSKFGLSTELICVNE